MMNARAKSLQKKKQSTTLVELRSRIPKELLVTFDSIVATTGVKDNAVGLLAATSQLCLDIAVVNSNGLDCTNWHEVLEELRLLLIREGLDLSKDSAQAGSARILKTAPFLSVPSFGTLPETRIALQSIRALLYLHCISNRRVISNEIANCLVKIAKSDESDFARLRDALSIDVNLLKNARDLFQPQTRQSKFISTIIAALSSRFPSPVKPTGDISTSIVIATNKDAAPNDNHNAAIRKNDGDNETGPNNFNLLSNLVKQAQFSSPRENSGIEYNWESLHPFELEHFFKLISGDLHANKFLLPLAIYMVLLTRVSPFYFNQIPLKETADSLWLDAENGYLVWPLSAVTKLKSTDDERDDIFTPLPSEITQLLQSIKKEVKQAESLADLFPVEMNLLKRQIRKYIREIDVGSHRPNIQRLTNSWGIHLLHLSGDETVSAILSRDFRIGTTPSFNYFTCDAKRFDELLSQSYQRLGLSGTHSPSFSVVSRRLVKDADVGQMLREILSNAKSAFETLPRNCHIERLVQSFNKIAVAIYLLTIFSVGGRSALHCGIGLHNLGLKNGLAILCDKIISAYHTSRIVPLIPIVVEWLQYYLKVLQLLAYRLQPYNKNLAHQIAWMLDKPQSCATLSLFFSLKADGRISPLGSGDLIEILNVYGMARNAGRHFVDFILREANIGSAALMAMQGRGGNGQEAYGSRSALAPSTILTICRQAIERKFASFNLPQAPSLSARTFHLDSTNQKTFRLPNWKRAESFHEKGPYERCPFHELTLAYSTLFEEMHHAWANTRIHSDIADLALSFTFRDGVCHKDELVAAVSEAIKGKIRKDKDGPFLDTCTEALGIRRVRLDVITVLIADTVRQSLPDLSQLDETLAGRIKSLTNEARMDSSIEFLTALAQSYFSIQLPGALRAWNNGIIHCRTTRFENLARNTFGVCEHPVESNNRATRRGQQHHTFNFIQARITKWSEKENNGGSNELLLRNLLEDLDVFSDVAMSTSVRMMYGFVLYLCTVVDSPRSVQRYFSPLKEFVISICRDIDDMREISEGVWAHNINIYMMSGAGRETRNSADISALNHLLDYCEIDITTYRKRDPIKSARSYVDIPTPREIATSSELLRQHTGDVFGATNLAALWHNLAAQMPSRIEEINGLRAADIIPTSPPAIVFTKESLGSLKTRNGNRINFIENNDQLANDLKLYRRQHLNFDPKGQTFLFGDKENRYLIANVDEFRDAAAHALYCASGSTKLVPYNFRHNFISTEIHKLLAPEAQHKVRPIDLRNGFYSLADRAGHADPLTSFQSYGCDFDIPRRQWMNYLNQSEYSKPSNEFLSSVTGLNSSTFRQRKKRNREIFHADANELGILLPDLSDLVRTGCYSLPWEGPATLTDPILDSARYIACRLSGNPPAEAVLITRISSDTQSLIEARFDKHFKKLLPKEDADANIASVKFLFGNDFSVITRSSYDWKPDSTTAELMFSSILHPHQPLQFSSIQCLHILSPISDHLKAVNFQFIVAVRTRSKFSSEDKSSLRSKARNMGFEVEALGSRNFDRDATVRVRLAKISKKPATWIENRQFMLAISSAILTTIFRLDGV